MRSQQNPSLTCLGVCSAVLFFCSHADALSVDNIKDQYIWDQLQELAKYSDTPPPSVTRLVYKKHDLLARKRIKELMKEAGLAIREDAVGNTFGRWEGSQSGAGTVMTGSHADAIVLGGRYDGILGVLGGIAAVKGLREAGFKPVKPIEVVQWTSEEADRFTQTCFGSRIATGYMKAEELDAFHDDNGTTFSEAASAAGYPAANSQAYLDGSKLDASTVDSYVELHIEQGPLLEAENKDVGIVTHIFGPSLTHVIFNGSGGHAGGMPMAYRHDPSLAAAELALHVEKAAHSTGAKENVATSGTWNIHPNVFNAVPRGASILLDIRDVDKDRRQTVIQAALDGAHQIGKRRGVQTQAEVVYAYPPITSGEKVLSAIRDATKQLSVSTAELMSKPYHDAAFMGLVAPTAMIFVPCKDGLSHHPDEHSSPKNVGDGVRTLALTLAKLAGTAEPAHVEL